MNKFKKGDKLSPTPTVIFDKFFDAEEEIFIAKTGNLYYTECFKRASSKSIPSLSKLSTSQLVAELESRRKCNKCLNTNTVMCLSCLWCSVWELAFKKGRSDNFKENTI